MIREGNEQMRGLLKMLVLGVLSKGDMNGYQLINSVSETFGKRPSTGTMYPLLATLEKDKYVVRENVGRSVVFSITDLGREFYDKLLNEDLDTIRRLIAVHLATHSKEDLVEKLGLR